jgi:pilus assembly protein FimV
VNLLLELSWAGGSPVVRQYSFLLDTQDRKPPPVAFPPPAADTAAPKPDAPAPPPVAALAPSAATPRPTAVVPTPTPPGTAPAESAPAAAIPEGGGTYVVQPGDSLLKVAQSTRYEGLSFAQMVVAIHRANEDAFSGGDMSKLKGGRTLKIPGRDAVAAVNAEEARQQVAALRGQPDAGRAQPEPARSRPAAREPGPAGDDVVARERALAESRDRAAVLEQTRGDLQRLIQAREKEIADLERELAAKSGKSQPVRK